MAFYYDWYNAWYSDSESPQSRRWSVARNDHYCPNAESCRHAVVDIACRTPGLSEIDDSERQPLHENRSSGGYSREGQTIYNYEYVSSPESMRSAYHEDEAATWRSYGRFNESVLPR